MASRRDEERCEVCDRDITRALANRAMLWPCYEEPCPTTQALAKECMGCKKTFVPKRPGANEFCRRRSCQAARQEKAEVGGTYWGTPDGR